MRVFQANIAALCLMAALTIQAADPKDWALSTSLGNSVGIGTFVTGYAQTPSWSTSLSLNPSYKLPAFWGIPRITLSAYEFISVWWLDSYLTSATNAQNRVVFSDLNLNAAMAKILDSKTTGISLGASTGVWVPVSAFSRNINRVLGLTVSAPVAWNKFGFNIGYTPSVSGWIYSSPNISAPCLNMPPATINPYDNSLNIDQAIQGLSIAGSGSENQGDGQCIVSGRQNTWSLSNSLSAGWSNKNHGVSAGLTWYINFLRRLSERPDLRSSNAVSQNFNEATMGRIAYSYTVPIDTSLVFSAGIMSWQSSVDSEGKLTFPFFDFVTPGRNQTQVFVQATVGI